MSKNIKNKIVLLISVLLIIIGVLYQINKTKEESIELNYKNIVIENEAEEANILETSEIEKEYIKIHITGQVKNSGIIELEKGERISDAIEKAGGTTELADLDNVNLAYVLEDGQKLYIPNKEEKNEQYIWTENGENIIEETKISSVNSVININKADKQQLQNIPGVGPSMAERIVNYREENGKFKSVEELKNISGIGEKKFESMKEYICVK